MIDKSLTERADSTLKTGEEIVLCELMNYFEISTSDSTLNEAGNIVLCEFLNYCEISKVFKKYHW